MPNSTIAALPKAIAIKVRIDGSVIATIKTTAIGLREARLLTEELPLTLNSFVELEFFDGADRLIVPARVSHVGDTEVTLVYEQTGEIFEHWHARQREAG